MQNSPFLNDSDFITWLANKAWIISIDDDSQINIKLLRDEAFVVIPEQLPELVLNRDLRPLQNSPKSPKFPPRHLGDFS